MKKIILILAGCFAFIDLHGAGADDIADAARVASRRDASDTTIMIRQHSDSAMARNTAQYTATNATRATTTGTRKSNIVNRSAKTDDTTPVNVIARATGAQTARTTSTPTVTNRTNRTGTTRLATPISARATKTATREDILNRTYSKCKTVFNDCMDEFCANKDAQLKRCACSARVNDFNRIKKQLADIDEKMLDFNQRLLTVGMDAKDVAVLNTATEGENAFYNTKDSSESKKTLDTIAKRLNTSFDSNNFSSSIGTVLSWSLDMDSAFDNIDYIGGISTTAKSGGALYSAALPVCREMASEVCSDEDLSLAESGYMVLIGQACDTVEKTYKTTMEQARNKVKESSALLDMSRLDAYQKANSDDILTCKRKMLAMLSDSTVCGENLGKCLDISGQYIDPSTGEAFLRTDLPNLGALISRPEPGESWTSVPGNADFVDFINSKKKFLEPAMENCKDISTTVWNEFVEDALSQIKIAQMRKLEEVRQSCTTLTTQCLIDANESITNFDSRALSVFGVTADMTANKMCQDILVSCNAILNPTDDQASWYDGMTGIQTDITFDTIKQTCAQVGRACIIQACTSTSGNFGLCENIYTSINRKSIINRTACWDEVKECVASAGTDAISEIFSKNNLDGYALYTQLYDTNTISEKHDGKDNDTNAMCVSENTDNCIYDICYDECANGTATNECRTCRLAESIWGNCEAAPATSLENTGSHNKIKVPQDTASQTTLLYWFAQNTSTEDAVDNCRDTTCGPGFRPVPDTTTNTIMCIDSNTPQNNEP